MPLLPLEPFVFPAALFAEGAEAPDTPGRWWALHTRPRAEKGLARRFLRRELAFFLPLYKRQWRSQGRLLCSHRPLFPGYIFLHGDDECRVAALETNLVARCIPVDDQGQLAADLARVYRLMVGGAPLTPEERLEPGDLVEVVAGPFAGLEGRFLRRGKQLKLLVEVQFLQQGVSVEIESWMVRPLVPARSTGTDDRLSV